MKGHKVQRYRIIPHPGKMITEWVRPVSGGEYVKYEDYARLESLILAFFDVAEYQIDQEHMLTSDPRRELSEILGEKI